MAKMSKVIQKNNTNWIGKNLFSFAIGKNYYNKIFRNFGLKSKTKSADGLNNKKRLMLLKRLLSKNFPAMIRVGNGYYHSKKYNPLLGKIITHWITLWGYDDRKQIFYVYDSGMLKKHWNRNIPIGNTTRSYNEILRDWSFGKWKIWSWYISRDSYLYIEIKQSNG